MKIDPESKWVPVSVATKDDDDSDASSNHVDAAEEEGAVDG